MPKKKTVMGVRRFREVFPHLTERVIVVRNGKPPEVLGTWIPDRSEETHKTESAKHGRAVSSD